MITATSATLVILKDVHVNQVVMDIQRVPVITPVMGIRLAPVIPPVMAIQHVHATLLAMLDILVTAITLATFTVVKMAAHNVTLHAMSIPFVVFVILLVTATPRVHVMLLAMDMSLVPATQLAMGIQRVHAIQLATKILVLNAMIQLMNIRGLRGDNVYLHT